MWGGGLHAGVRVCVCGGVHVNGSLKKASVLTRVILGVR